MEELAKSEGFWQFMNNVVYHHKGFLGFFITLSSFTYLSVKSPELIKWIINQIFEIFRKEED